MRAVITGATGAIGMALIQELVADGAEILVICREGSGRNKRIPALPGIRKLELNMDAYKTYVPVAADTGYDVFFHMAWSGTTGANRNDASMQQANVEYAKDSVALAHKLGCKTYVGVGSQAEYGRVEGKLCADTSTNPETEYGKAKLMAGDVTRQVCERYGMNHIWTRVLSVYGPYDTEHSMIISAARKLMAGEVPQFTKGEQQWDYMYSEDAAKALIAVAQKGLHNTIYPLGSGKIRPLSEYIEKLRDAVNPHAQIDMGAIPYGENQVMYLCADISKLKQDTGFEPQTDFEEGIKKTVHWLREEGDNHV